MLSDEHKVKSIAWPQKNWPSKFSSHAANGASSANLPMAKYRIETLDASSPVLLDACTTLLVNAFAKPERYSAQRLNEELRGESGLFYRQFFVAVAEGEIIGVGGVKAADWASHTHLLYLSAVAPEHRGQGIGRALLKARIEWLEKHFAFGRILVSSAKAKRFHEFGFSDFRKGVVEGRHLMMRHFERAKKG